MKQTTSIPVTSDSEDIGELYFWYGYLKSVGRPCAIIYREVYYKKGLQKQGPKGMRYSVWRNVSEDEQKHYALLHKTEVLTGDYEIIQSHGGFRA